MRKRSRARVLEYLRTHHVMTLATQGDAGPWAAAVFYVNENLTLYWLSAPTSRHSLHLARNPQAAATVHEDYADWPQIKGVQIEGLANEIAGDEAERARTLYGGKYPVIGNRAQMPAAIAAALARASWYKLVPNRIWFIDNSIAFGHREELDADVALS